MCLLGLYYDGSDIYKLFKGPEKNNITKDCVKLHYYPYIDIRATIIT